MRSRLLSKQQHQNVAGNARLFRGFPQKGGMRARRETKTNRPQRSKIIAMQQRTCSVGDTARTPFFVRLYKSRLSNYSADLLFNDH
jgi:hypothetical protein